MQEDAGKTISHLESITQGFPVINSELQSFAQTIDVILSIQWHNLFLIYAELFPSADADLLEEQVKEVLHGHQTEISSLKYNYQHGQNLKLVNTWISTPQHSIQVTTCKLIYELPGIEFDGDHPDPFPFSLAVSLFNNSRLLFTLPGWSFKGFCFIYHRL
jgi:hypothetical protein